MNRNILRRLQKLEQKERRQLEKADEWYRQLVVRAIAFYLGNATPKEPLDQAYARGLGYPSEKEYRKALEAGDADVGFKIASAHGKLMVKFGITFNDKAKVTFEAYTRMKDGLPFAYRRALFEFARSQNSRPVVQGFEHKQSALEFVEEFVEKLSESRRTDKNHSSSK